MALFDRPTVRQDLQRLCESTDWSPFADKTMLITGANGHLATYLAYSLLYAVERGRLRASLVLLSRDAERLRERYAPFAGRSHVRLLAADVCDPIDLTGRIDFLFHLAGNASPRSIAADPVGILRANVGGTFRAAETARLHPGCKIVYASTREVYGAGERSERLSEHSFGSLDPTLPRSCYPESKRAAEALLEAYRSQYGVRYATARIAHCYGPGMNLRDDGRVMADLIGQALDRRRITVRSDGSMRRSFCYITDAIAGLLLLAAHPGEGEVFNLANETEEISVLELAQLIARRVPGTRVESLGEPIDARRYCTAPRVPLDCSALMRLGWRPRIGLEEGIGRTLESFSSR